MPETQDFGGGQDDSAASNAASAMGLTRGFAVPPDTPFNSKGIPYSRELLTMSPQEKANVEASMRAIREAQSRGESWGGGQQVAALPPAGQPGGAAGDPPAPQISPGMQTVLGTIRKAEGTSQGEGHVLYGGQQYEPGHEHPAREGWQGGYGPDGRPTHAADRYQWQPGTWDDEKKRFAARGINLDFANPQHHDMAAADLAARTYQTNTGRSLEADAAAGKVDYKALAGVWQGLGPPSLKSSWIGGSLSPQARAFIDEMHTRGERDHAENVSLINEYMKTAREAPAGSKERSAAIEDMRRTSHKLLEGWEDLVKNPPVKQPVDMWQNFGSAATVVGLLGGLLSRRHLTTALGAAGEAMQAINTNNEADFQKAYKTWEQQTSLGIKMVDLQNQEIRLLLDDEKMARDEKNSRLQTIFQAYGMTHQDQALRAGNDLRVAEMIAANDRSAAQLKNQTEAIKLQVYANLKAKYIGEGLPEPDADAKAAREAGIVRAPAETQSKGREEAVKKAIAGDIEKFKKDNPNATQSEIDAEEYKSRVRHEKEMGAAAHQPRSAPAMYLDKYMQENPNATAAELSEATAEFRRLGSVETGFASGILGRQIVSLNTVADHLKLVKEYADALHNGQIPRANAIANRVAVELGKPEVTNFEAGRDIMADEVVRLLTSTGGTEADRKGMQSRLGSAMSPAQLAGALTAFNRFVGGRFEALEQQYAGNDPKRKERFENTLLTEKARELYRGTKEGDKAPAAAGGYSSPDDVLRAVDSGKLGADEAKRILIEKFGYAPK